MAKMANFIVGAGSMLGGNAAPPAITPARQFSHCVAKVSATRAPPEKPAA